MDPRSERLAAGLRRAIEAEGAGHHFYRMAAAATEDEQGKRVFEQLAEEELQHLRYLKANYEAVLATGALDTQATLAPRQALAEQSPIFSTSIKLRISQAHFEMSALSIGIQLELNSMGYYRSLAEQADDDAVRQFFGELADWEQSHYRALLTQQDELQSEYWASGGFAPF